MAFLYVFRHYAGPWQDAFRQHSGQSRVLWLLCPCPYVVCMQVQTVLLNGSLRDSPQCHTPQGPISMISASSALGVGVSILLASLKGCLYPKLAVNSVCS